MPLIFEPFFRQVLAVDALAVDWVGEPESAAADDALAGAADGEQRQAHRLRLGERARVDGVAYLGGDQPGAATADVLQLLHFDVQFGSDPHERLVEFGAEALGDAPGIEREPVAHRFFSFRSPAFERFVSVEYLLDLVRARPLVVGLQSGLALPQSAQPERQRVACPPLMRPP